jgi:hypothetical protein
MHEASVLACARCVNQGRHNNVPHLALLLCAVPKPLIILMGYYHYIWRDGRVVEGTPLLRVQGRNPLESSNLSLSAI